MELYLSKAIACNAKITSIYNDLKNEKNIEWEIKPQLLNGINTNFFIKVNKKNLSIACSVDTGGEIESIIINDNGELDNDSLMFHEDINALKNFLQELS
jgi:hypothetical protein